MISLVTFNGNISENSSFGTLENELNQLKNNFTLLQSQVNANTSDIQIKLDTIVKQEVTYTLGPIYQPYMTTTNAKFVNILSYNKIKITVNYEDGGISQALINSSSENTLPLRASVWGQSDDGTKICSLANSYDSSTNMHSIRVRYSGGGLYFYSTSTQYKYSGTLIFNVAFY